MSDVPFEIAADWCKQNPKWRRICDIKHSDRIQLGWDELPKSFRKQFEKYVDPEEFWQENGPHPYRHRYGFIGEDGQLYSEVTDVPAGMNLVMVFETGARPGTFFQGGRHARSGVIGNSRRKGNVG